MLSITICRFINLLPVGSRLNIQSMGDNVKEVLPTTTVTEANRDGLFGRIPRRVLEDARLGSVGYDLRLMILGLFFAKT